MDTDDRPRFEARVETLLDQMDKRLASVERRLDSVDSHLLGLSTRLEGQASHAQLGIWCASVMGVVTLVVTLATLIQLRILPIPGAH